MTQHTELIERLRASSRWWFDRNVRNSVDADAIAALEAQAREIERLCKDAALVAARERERCAKACETVAASWSFHMVAPSAAMNCAAAIRALNTEDAAIAAKGGSDG